MGKVNFGCGCQQGPSGHKEDCNTTSHPETPYNNKVPPDFTETSGAESSNVKNCMCHNKHENELPRNGNGAQCFWNGVAIDTKMGDSPDETHTMLDWRMDHQDGPST